jgi:hypothetical protein
MTFSATIVTSGALTGGGPTQDFISPGFGTPKAAIFTATLAQENLSGVNATLSIGLTDGTNQYVYSTLASDNSDPTFDRRRGTNDEVVLWMNHLDGTIDGEANFVSFIEDGVRISYGDFPASGYQISCTMFTGDSLSAYVGQFTSSSTQDASVDITAPNFPADQVIGATCRTTANDSSVTSAAMSIGFFDSGDTDVNISMNWGSANGSSAGDPNVYAFLATNRFCMNISNTNTFGNFELTQHPLGFTATTRGTSASVTDVGYLAMAYSGLPHWADIIESPTSTGPITESGLGFSPAFTMFGPSRIGSADLDSLLNFDDVEAEAVSFGGFTPDGKSFACSAGVNTLSPIPQEASNVSTSLRPLNHPDIGSHPIPILQASYVENVASGFTLHYTSVDASARSIIAIAAGESDIPVPVTPSGVTSCGQWNSPITLNPCEKIRLKLTGSGVQNVSARVTLGMDILD